PLAGAHLPAPRHRHCGWFCRGRILLLLLSRAFASAASCGESPHRFVLRSGSGGRLAHGRDLLAMGRFASLANGRARYRGDRLLRSGSDRFSQDERNVAVEHAEMGEFIGNHSRDGAVYVHCKIGYSRSAAAVAAYLIMSGKANTVKEAFAIIRRVRPSVVIRPEVISALFEFDHRLRSAPGG